MGGGLGIARDWPGRNRDLGLTMDGASIFVSFPFCALDVSFEGSEYVTGSRLPDTALFGQGHFMSIAYHE